MNSSVRLFTVKQIASWVLCGQTVEGLTGNLISFQRAYAIINNPYVKETDAVLSAVFVNDELASYTASFPDYFDGNRIWWCSTLYCYPKYEGRGYGLVALGSLIEAHKEELTFDRWGAKETVLILECLGFETLYCKRYHLGEKNINTKSVVGKFYCFFWKSIKCIHRRKYTGVDYSVAYSSFIDGESYQFICSHNGGFLFTREQKMMNWILSYPFVVESRLISKTECTNVFTSASERYTHVVVKVFSKERLIGVYILKMEANSLSIVYLYYDELYSDVVFSSVVDHVVGYGVQSFHTENYELHKFVRERVYFPKAVEENVSFSYLQKNLPFSVKDKFQMGDGDSFV